MKLAYLANVRIPSERAHSTQIVHMCQAFSENGCEVDLIANRRVLNENKDIDTQYEIESSFNLIRLNHVWFNPKIKISYYLSELFFSLNFIIKGGVNNYDIIFSRSEWIIWFLTFFLPTDKLVWESHEAKLNLPARRVLIKNIKVVVISEGIEDFYVKYGVDKAKLIVAHDGIDDSFLEPQITKIEARERLGLSSDKKIAMYIGGFDRWKGIETFFETSNLLTEVSFVAIGGSEESIEKYRKKYPSVQFLGQLPYKDLKYNQRAADVLVIPNTSKNVLSSRFTSPLKLFAHMASKVPLIISDIPSLTKVLSEKTATLFVSDDEVSLAKAITDSLNSESSQSKADRAHAKALEYTWSKRAQAILVFITKIIKK